MTLTVFLFLLIAGASVASLLTEALKKIFMDVSSNFLALINSVILGVFGMCIVYILLEIPFNIKNITCIIVMAFLIWLGSMIGYDKLIQTLEQIKGGGLS